MSVYLALHTSATPSIEDIAEFGRIALLLGADPKGGTTARFRDDPPGQLTVVLPIPEETRGEAEAPTDVARLADAEGAGVEAWVSLCSRCGPAIQHLLTARDRARDAEVRRVVEAVLPSGPRPFIDLHTIGAWDMAQRVRRALAEIEEGSP